MQSRIVAVAVVLVASLLGCSDDDPGAGLRITPSEGGAVAIHGPTKFTAEVSNGDPVTWEVAGGATLSATTGYTVVYSPPLGTSNGTLTARAGRLSAAVQVTSSPTELTAKTIPQLSAAVTVQYDAQDIPHIRCAAANDCLAVQGYVHAHDRLFPMDFTRRVARSRLAELIGAAGLEQDIQLRVLFTTREGHRLEDDLVAALKPANRAQMDAYAAGVNAYLAELRTTPGAALPGEYAQLPFAITAADIPDWTPEDSLAIGRFQAFQLSESIEQELANRVFEQTYGPDGTHPDAGKMTAWIRAAAPRTERAHTLSPTSVGTVSTARASRPASLSKRSAARSAAAASGATPDAWNGAVQRAAAQAAALKARLRPLDADVGSNNWVVSADKSATGKAMVANDPHLPLQYPPLFHLAVLTSTNPDDHLDLAGGVFSGIPGALVGRGAHVGWGVTVVGYDVTDVYREQFLPQCPVTAPCVLFKGAPVTVKVVPQTFRVRTAAGVVDASTVTNLGIALPPAVFVVPHHGPIIEPPDDGGVGLSVRWTGHESNTQDSAAINGLNTALDVAGAMESLKGFATGAQNFVLADDAGKIGYYPHALVPVRRFADINVVGRDDLIRPWFPLPGDGSAEWGDGVHDCAAAAPDPGCWIADDVLPQGTNPARGYYVTANSDPTFPSKTDDNDPLAHPPYLSFSFSDTTGFRATRIEQMLDAVIAAKGKVSVEDMEAIQGDHVSRPGMLFNAYISRIPASAGPSELKSAQDVLAKWAANGYDCPTGLTGIDPASPAVTDGKVQDSSAGCFLFHLFVRRVARNVFVDDLAVAKQSVGGLAALQALMFMLDTDPTTAENAAVNTFCNDVDPASGAVTQRTCLSQVVAALVESYRTLSAQVGADPQTWLWGRVHTIRPVSLLPLVTTNYQPGPYARPGGAFTVDVGSPSLTANNLSFGYTSGGNVRHISVMDAATPVVRMQLPGPVRDAATNFPGPDLLEQWVKNQYFDFAFGAQIDGVAVSTQSFHP